MSFSKPWYQEHLPQNQPVTSPAAIARRKRYAFHSDKGNAGLCKRLYSSSSLTSADDNRGNRTQYTLDAMSNHAREEVKDARGNTTG